MRSSQELAFRLKQEIRNYWMYLRSPVPSVTPAAKVSFLPDSVEAAEAVRGTPYAERIVALANQILDHRFPILGLEIEMGREIQWQRDHLNGSVSEMQYFRRIRYLDFSRVGDHKVIWELNRHQHLILLGQAYRLTGGSHYAGEISRQLESWIAANPFQQGINWASALEVAIRALSWTWVLHLAGDGLGDALRGRLMTQLYRHGLYIANNLSYYFSPNTHLLGEAVALHALGLLFREVPAAERWESRGAQLVSEQIERQIRPDGSHFEQSSYYHLYALDMLLFHAIVSKPSRTYLAVLSRMAEYLDALAGPSQTLPLLGDDDGGRFFHPYGACTSFQIATLATCGVFLNRPSWIRKNENLYEQGVWWLGPRAIEGLDALREPRWDSRLFADAGTAVITSGDYSCIIDAGPFGPYRSGHSHSDTLSIVARSKESEILIDPGTFTYVSDARWRNFFRGTGAHNTVSVRGCDQADAAGPFAWRNPPRVAVRQWISDATADYLDAECCYRNCRHRRQAFFLKSGLLFILDQVGFGNDDGGPWLAEQFWHPGAPINRESRECFRIATAPTASMLVLDCSCSDDALELIEGGDFGWKSPAFGIKEAAAAIVRRRLGQGTVRFGAVVIFSAPPLPCVLTLAYVKDEAELALSGGLNESVVFHSLGRQ
jgi:Heparinase II/III-like protein/Heparinase II/III N-terminus